MNDTGADLRTLRETFGLTQRQLAAEMGNAQSRISEWERRASVKPNVSLRYRKAVDRLYARQILDV